MLALVALTAILLGGCHKRDDAAGALDAGADARARTQAKTLADLAAAERASATALPRSIAAAPDRGMQRVVPPEDGPAVSQDNAADPNL